MAKPNFQFQKRQKELERKKKNEEKLLRKRDKGTPESEENADPSPVGNEAAAAEGDRQVPPPGTE